jgi:DNA repair exonuclease SbcCD ATPase subunit
MGVQQQEDQAARFHVENVGGIDETDVTVSSGVTVLRGRNATNRTSFLQAIMAVCGSDNASIKGDADEALVDLTIGDEQYTRRLHRQNGAVTATGEPYLDDPTLADLFAFLDESNAARRGVERGDDLRELLMRPVDTAEIQAEIDDLVQQRRRVDEELDEIDDLKGDLPALEAERTQLEEQIAEKRDDLSETEAELDAHDREVEESREEKDRLEEKLEQLRAKRSDLDDVRYDIETEQESLAELRRERAELEEELSDLPDTPVGDIGEIEAEIDRLRTQKQQAESSLNELQSIIGFNEKMLEDAEADVFDSFDEADDVTDRLLPDDEVRCWTCGSEVETDQIETTLATLRELSQQERADVSALRDDISALQSDKRELEQTQKRREQSERRLSQIEEQIERRESTVETLKEERETLTEEIASIEETVEEMEDESYSEILDLHKEANQLEYELGRLESDLERVEDEIAGVEDRLDEQETLQDKRETFEEQIEELRTRIDRLEDNVVAQFNDHMETVLDLLDYDNIDRIWLERVETDARDGRKTVSKSTFELHVIRTTGSGTAYEDTVDHLSESEREVTGLIFALAGYLIHEVYDSVPFMLLDSLEAIDSPRIAALVEYLAGYSDYLVVALLPEDAEALDDEYTYVTEV